MVCSVLAMMHVVTQMPGFVNQADISAGTRLESRLLILSFFVAFAVISLRLTERIRFVGAVTFLGMLTYPLYLIHNIGKALILRPLVDSQKYGALVLALGFSFALAGTIVFLVDRYWRPYLTKWLRRMVVPASPRARI
jgi:peptidoglycan/LPS O-acetylase OafA/YrhL